MSIVVNINGESINYPQTGDTNWGDEATDFAVQTSSALAKVGLSTGTTVDLPGTLDVTGNTTLDANLSVGGNASVTGTTSLTGNVTLTNNLTVNGNTQLGNANTDTIGVTGIVNVDAGTLYVDPTNNRVGINTTTPAQALDVVGTLGVTGIETISNTTDASSSTNGALIVSGGVGIAKKLYVGNDLSVGGSLTATGGINPPYWNIVDQKANGTAGGTFTSGAWRTRDLNTTIGSNTITGSSLSSNQFTLPAGTYRIFASAPSYAVTLHKAKLRNITDSTDTLIGTSERSDQNYNGATRSFVSGTFTIASQKTFELQHQCSASLSFGYASSFGVDEIYSIVELWKLA